MSHVEILLSNKYCMSHVEFNRWVGRNHREKINIHVEFEEDLHIEGFCHPDIKEEQTDSMYKLSAVVMHHGRGFGSGHYTSYVWNDEAGGYMYYGHEYLYTLIMVQSKEKVVMFHFLCITMFQYSS